MKRGQGISEISLTLWLLGAPWSIWMLFLFLIWHEEDYRYETFGWLALKFVTSKYFNSTQNAVIGIGKYLVRKEAFYGSEDLTPKLL
jgi:hypothetical protein